MRLAITGLGLVTSVGHDARTACASIRAGMQRPRELTYYSILDLEEQESKPLTGRPVHGYSDGFTGTGLWLRLALGAAEDMLGGATLPQTSNSTFWARTGLCVATPDLAPGRYDEDDRLRAESVRQTFLAPLVNALGWSAPPSSHHIISVGHTGAIEAIDLAGQMIARQEWDRAVIVCVDSYVDLLSLEWLDAADRLKTEDNPNGLIAGEAGACFMVETVQTAAERSAQPLALLEGWTVTPAVTRPLSDQPVTGEALATALRETLAHLQIERFDGLAIGDLNGESWRSQDWGSALVRLGPLMTDRVEWWFPCDSLGETGAASAAIAICLGATALARGYVPGGAVLISASGESGAAACALLSPGAAG